MPFLSHSQLNLVSVSSDILMIFVELSVVFNRAYMYTVFVIQKIRCVVMCLILENVV